MTDFIGAIEGFSVFVLDFVVQLRKAGLGPQIPFVYGDRASHDFFGRQSRFSKEAA